MVPITQQYLFGDKTPSTSTGACGLSNVFGKNFLLEAAALGVFGVGVFCVSMVIAVTNARKEPKTKSDRPVRWFPCIIHIWKSST